MKAVNSDVVAIPARQIDTFARRMAPKKQSQWIPAIAGNSANPVALQEPFAGSWDAYWATFTAANPSATLADARGAHGVDAAANTSWAVVDHNSSFAVIPVPEPAETGLVCVGLGGLFFALRRRSRA